MKFYFKPLVCVLPFALAACGGGGGSGGESNLQYSISLRAVKTQLPVNVADEQPGLGAYAPYTTTVYVNAKEGDRPILGGSDEVFGCNIDGGLDTAALYYLDGSDKDLDQTTKKHKAYRSITLGSNSGGNSFHVHSGNLAGVVNVTCSVTDPRDKRVYTDAVSIKVGGASTSTAASVVTRWSSSTTPRVEFLGSQGNSANIPTAAVLQSEIYNDNNQPVSSSGKSNLQVSIVPTGLANDASAGATLMAGGKTAQSLLLTSNFGNAQYSISSGSKKGFILLESIADRADNDVSNGIQEPIKHSYLVQVRDHVASGEALEIDATQVEGVEIQNGQPFMFPLQATGGTSPYTWSLGSPLPNGLTLSSNGIIQGTPKVENPGKVNVSVIVTDADGTQSTKVLPLTIVGTLPPAAVDLSISGCSGDVNTVCPLPEGVIGSTYSYGLSASGGTPITWSLRGAPTWLRADGVGTTGMLFSGEVLTCKHVGIYPFFVTASNATNAVTRQVSITIPTNDTCNVVTTPATPGTP